MKVFINFSIQYSIFSIFFENLQISVKFYKILQKKFLRLAASTIMYFEGKLDDFVDKFEDEKLNDIGVAELLQQRDLADRGARHT